jgi:hypothetical protein
MMQKSKIPIEQQKGHLFVPIASGNKIYVGGNYSGEKAPFNCFLT